MHKSPIDILLYAYVKGLNTGYDILGNFAKSCDIALVEFFDAV